MKILYAIQGTGNGHISRARDIIPLLQQKGDLDILVSGTQSDVQLPYPIKYRFFGLSFVFGKKGGIDFWGTYKKSRLLRLYKEVKSLPVSQYDLVISDFEPVSAWACKLHKKKCIGLSHQAAVIHKKSPHPTKIDPLGKAVLKHYAPVDIAYGFHFQSYADQIKTPVIRSEIRNAKPKLGGHYTVYLPAYSDERILKVLGAIKNVNWQVFSKNTQKEYLKNNIKFLPIDNNKFIRSMVQSLGIICGAGFETPAEAIYLGKKLMVVPMKSQYEQQCNAAALMKIGITSIPSFKFKQVSKIEDWLKNGIAIRIDFPDQTASLIEHLINENVIIAPKQKIEVERPVITPLDFSKLARKEILSHQPK